MDWIKKFLSPKLESEPDNVQLPSNPTERYVRVRNWLASLSPGDRARFTEKYLVPVFGEEAAKWVRQQLAAERAQLQVSLDMELAELRNKYTGEIQPLILRHIRETLERVEKESDRASFKDPLLRTLWKVAVARTGLDIIASGQTTYDDMLQDFDKLIELLMRMAKTYDAESSSLGEQ